MDVNIKTKNAEKYNLCPTQKVKTALPFLLSVVSIPYFPPVFVTLTSLVFSSVSFLITSLSQNLIFCFGSHRTMASALCFLRLFHCLSM